MIIYSVFKQEYKGYYLVLTTTDLEKAEAICEKLKCPYGPSNMSIYSTTLEVEDEVMVKRFNSGPY